MEKSMEELLFLQKVTLALARGGAASQVRLIDDKNPVTWEFSAFSQNGEDGIIDYLSRKIINPNYYFVEIGAADGIENNTAWLAFGKKYEGLFLEGNEVLVSRIKQYIEPMLLGVKGIQLFADLDNVEEVVRLAQYQNPDIFSLDIDGNDYYVAKSLLDLKFRPKIFVVEYNSAYGPNQKLTIKYDKDFSIDFSDYKNYLYYGVSIAGWKELFAQYGYRFVTVEHRGVNAFFIEPSYFDLQFINKIKGLNFAENFYQTIKYGVSWEEQFEYIMNKKFHYIE